MRRLRRLCRHVVLKGRRTTKISPLHARVAVGCDSITATEGIDGWVPWTMMRAGGRFYPRYIYNYAVAGYTTQDFITNRLASMKAQQADINIIMVGTNDLGTSIATETVKTNMRFIWDELLANGRAGSRVLVINVIPRFSGGWTGAMETERLILNAWIKTQPGIEWVEVESLVSGNFKDGTHPNCAGARIIAGVVYPKLMSMIDNTDIYGNLDLVGGNLFPNPTMAGGNSITEGVIADNWTITVPSSATGRVTLSKGTLASGETAQVITLGGSAPSAISLIEFKSDLFNVGGVSGERFEAYMRVEYASMGSVLTQRLYMVNTPNLGEFGLGTDAGTTMSGLTAVSGVMRTAARNLTGAGAAQQQLNYTFRMNTGSAPAGVIKIGRPFVRKVPVGL